mgnify:FL=1
MKEILIFLLFCGATFAAEYGYAPEASGFEEHRREILQNRRKIESGGKILQDNLERGGSHGEQNRGLQNFPPEKDKMQSIKEQNDRAARELKMRNQKLRGNSKRR